jgi:hypothetical protein
MQLDFWAYILCFVVPFEQNVCRIQARHWHIFHNLWATTTNKHTYFEYEGANNGAIVQQQQQAQEVVMVVGGFKRGGESEYANVIGG